MSPPDPERDDGPAEPRAIDRTLLQAPPSLNIDRTPDRRFVEALIRPLLELRGAA